MPPWGQRLEERGGSPSSVFLRPHTQERDVALPLPVHLPPWAPPCRAGLHSINLVPGRSPVHFMIKCDLEGK